MKKKKCRKKWPVTLIASACLVLLMGGLIIQRIGMDNVKLMYKLQVKEGAILPMDGAGMYVAKVNSRQTLLKEKMAEEGWTYVAQEGSGYFFEKEGQQTIVTARQIWTRHFIQYKVADLGLGISLATGE